MTNENLFSKIESLRAEATGLRAKGVRDQERLKLYEEEVSHLHEMIRDFKRHRFGSKSERWESPEQMAFNEAEMLAKSARPFITLKTSART